LEGRLMVWQRYQFVPSSKPAAKNTTAASFSFLLKITHPEYQLSDHLIPYIISNYIYF
jgi:hypothetical protein